MFRFGRILEVNVNKLLFFSLQILDNFMSIIIDSNHVALDITWLQCKEFLPETAM